MKPILISLILLFVISSHAQTPTSRPSAEYKVDREAVLNVVRANLKNIRSCYENGLKKKPDLYGDIKINWEVGAGGKVLNAQLTESTLGDAKVEKCIVEKFQAIKDFPVPEGNNTYEINFPMSFSSKKK